MLSNDQTHQSVDASVDEGSVIIQFQLLQPAFLAISESVVRTVLLEPNPKFSVACAGADLADEVAANTAFGGDGDCSVSTGATG